MPLRLLLPVLGVYLGIAALHASSPAFWRTSTQADFLRGEVENLSIDSDGRLVLGPLNTVIHEPAAPFLWTIVATADGTLYAGSGNEGKVFRVEPDGTASTFFDADELEVHALALAGDGTLYVGTSPDGRVYRVAPDGEASVFFEPDQRYIWALELEPDGSLYVATGDQGIIYHVTSDGTGRELYRSRATHVLALARDQAGRLLAGTESPGQVLRIEREGKAFALLDSGFREIRSLRVDASGTIYAAALSGRPPTPEPRATDPPQPDTPRAPVPTVSAEITGIAIADAGPAAAAQPVRSPERQPRGAVFRIEPDGGWDIVWESNEDSPYDVAVEADGSLLVGTGNTGKVFRVVGEPARIALLARASAQQVTQFVTDGRGRRYYATANPGKIFQLSADTAPAGSYTSDVRDAGTVATWGTIRWRAATDGDARVQLLTRSGNTGVPDDTWSDWSTPYTNSDGQQITSPTARYLQWQATLTANRGHAMLSSVTAAYLQRNLRPRVVSIVVHPPGTVFQRPFSSGEFEIAGYEEMSPEGRPGAAPPGTVAPQGTPGLGRRGYQKSLQTFTWTADDGNDDRLVFDVFYRQATESEWKVLRRGLSEPILAWDTTSVPDGTYVIRLVASDAPSNSPGTALTGELVSTTFDIDNTPPRIEVAPARRDGARQIIPFVVRDNQSPVRRVEYSLDGDGWRVIYPLDGIPDSQIEEFELVLEADRPASSVIIRATDAMNNSSTAIATPD